MAKYDLSNFRPIVETSEMKVSIYDKHIALSIGLRRKLRAMNIFGFEILRNDHHCICFRIVPNPNKEEPLPSFFSVERLVTCEIRRCKVDILDTYEMTMREDQKLEIFGICDEEQKAIFFPKENATISEVKKRNTDELQ